MVGRRLSVVTLGEGNMALSSNYLKVELARAYPSNVLLDVEVAGVTDGNLRQAAALAVLQ